MDSLPVEIIFQILEYLSYFDLKRVARLCQRFHLLKTAKSGTFTREIDRLLFRDRPLKIDSPTSDDDDEGVDNFTLHPALMKRSQEPRAKWHEMMNKLSYSSAINENALSPPVSSLRIHFCYLQERSDEKWGRILHTRVGIDWITVGDVIRAINGDLHSLLRAAIESEGDSRVLEAYRNDEFGWWGVDSVETTGQGGIRLCVQFQSLGS